MKTHYWIGMVVALWMLSPMCVSAQTGAEEVKKEQTVTPVEQIFRTQPYLQRPIGDEITICAFNNFHIMYDECVVNSE